MTLEERDQLYELIVERAAGRVARRLLDVRGEQILREEVRTAVELERALELLTPEEAGRLLRTPPKTLKSWANEGRLSGVMIGRRRMFTRGAVLEFIARSADGTRRNGTFG